MEEAKKEDMSTEQILSSIRNILTDENSETTLPTEDEDIENEDIMDLSEVALPEKEVLLGEPVVESQAIQGTANEEEDVYDLSPVMVIRQPSETSPEEALSSHQEEPYDLSEKLMAKEEIYPLSDDQEIEEEPSSEGESDDVFELGTEEEFVEQAKPLEPLANAVGAEAGIATKAQAEAETEERKSVSSEGVENFESEKTVAVEPVKYSEAEKSVAIESLEAEKPALEDVAGNIISAFSNLFNNYTPAKKEKVAKTSVSVYENSELKAEVQKAVEGWVVKNIDTDMNIKDVVNEEVAAQVRVWLDENLPNLIQSSINQELERVMVKVDKAQ